jgi:hypothetical protein
MSAKICAEQFQVLIQSHISIAVIYSLVTCTQTLDFNFLVLSVCSNVAVTSKYREGSRVGHYPHTFFGAAGLDHQ